MTDPQVVLVAGILLISGVAAMSVADRLQVPAFALCLVVGMAIGTDGAGLVHFDDFLTAQRIGTACLGLVLFEGGWRSDLTAMRPVWGIATRLALVGTVLTALLAGVAIAVFFQRPFIEAFLLGSLLACTDGAAVFGLVRRLGLDRRLALTLEGEAGLNDPVAILLVISLVTWVRQSGGELGDIAVLFGRDLVLGLLVGLVVGILGTVAFKIRWLPAAGLYSVASVALGMVALGAAETLGGSGLLAIYVAGLVLGNQARRSHKSVTSFQHGLSSLADIALFVTLGLVVSPAQLENAVPEGVAIALILAFFARPLAVFTLTTGGRFSTGERVLLSWAGLRGAVGVILATIPITQGIPGSLEYFNIVFVVVLASAILQGATVRWLTRALGLTAASTALPTALAEAEFTEAGVLEAEYAVYPTSDAVGRTAGDLHLPTGAGLTTIVRAGQAFSPSNSTRIRAGDVLRFLVSTEHAEVLHAHLSTWGEPAWPPPASGPAVSLHGEVGPARWTVFRREAVRPHASAFIARERLWWRQMGGHLRLFAVRLLAINGRRS
ncbi:MAG: potassium/hydrogen antiporter [Gaiellales bacterium]|nr:potassium/hydrogen antiporter [Gaiellales bacterium]